MGAPAGRYDAPAWRDATRLRIYRQIDLADKTPATLLRVWRGEGWPVLNR
jgi:hypothetical protein